MELLALTLGFLLHILAILIVGIGIGIAAIGLVAMLEVLLCILIEVFEEMDD